ncbi:MAG: hypothetical protein DMG15_00665, partial [Acidobacteria bacterium]
MSETKATSIRILLVDDHPLFLSGLRLLIQSEPGLSVVGQAVNRMAALDGSRLKPDIILLDLDLGSEISVDFLPDLLRIGCRRVSLLSPECLILNFTFVPYASAP